MRCRFSTRSWYMIPQSPPAYELERRQKGALQPEVEKRDQGKGGEEEGE